MHVQLHARLSRVIAALVAALVLTACASASRTRDNAGAGAGAGPVAGARTPAEQARADSGRPAYTPADVAFMQGMIGHHAQALVMAGLAATNESGSAVRVLAERIDVSQRDEILFMQRWLGERSETVPAVADAHAGHAMPAGSPADHSAHMPGMLTAEQLAKLTAARGAEFDRLFLTYMIQHHEGAIVMVRKLFGTPGSGQEVNVFLFASEVEADQTAEIDRMRRMLSTKLP